MTGIADVGLRQALANLGHPRVLAAGYLAAEGRPLPQFRKGAWWAAATRPRPGRQWPGGDG